MGEGGGISGIRVEQDQGGPLGSGRSSGMGGILGEWWLSLGSLGLGLSGIEGIHWDWGDPLGLWGIPGMGGGIPW